MLTTSEFQNMVFSGSTEKYSDEEWNQMLEYAKANDPWYEKEINKCRGKEELHNYLNEFMFVDVIRKWKPAKQK